VIIAVHGSGQWLEVAIDSVSEQTMESWELICVLDDATVEVEQFVSRRMVDPRIRLVKLEKHRGAAAARNEGLASAQGLFIAILDSDDEWTPNHLELAVNYLEENHDVVLVGSHYQPIDSKGFNLGVAVRVPRRLVATKLLIQNGFCHSAVVYRSIPAKSVGAYPTGVSIGEDYCLWLKLAGIGNIQNLGVVSVMYRRHESQMSRKVLDRSSSQQILLNKLELAKNLRIPSFLVKVIHSVWLKRQNLSVR
jgi:hypothetical protein